MCDTIFLRQNNNFYIGKNSDRSPNEAHLLIKEESKDYDKDSYVKTTYITIPQVSHTYTCVLLKPHWMFGCEMGYNEWGLNIGNEAIFTKVKKDKRNGLIGMDLIRLALERCKTVKEAIDLIIKLVNKYGQEGNCGYHKNFYYHNAFLLSDGNETKLLEIANKTYAIKDVKDKITISNCVDIQEDYIEKSSDFTGSFKKNVQNNFMTFFAGSEIRKKITSKVLDNDEEVIKKMMKALKSHERDNLKMIDHSIKSPCMHAGGLIGDQTTGSYVGLINKVYFVTGSSFPCMSFFKPVSLKGSALFNNEDDALVYWLKHELLHRHIMAKNIDEEQYKKEISLLEEKYYHLALEAKNDDELDKISLDAFKEEKELMDKYWKVVKDKPININKYWNKKTKELFTDYEKYISRI
ncbi:MAG: carcinine hydrolase/isopenicillin-N N-acyltransferase family protein [Bacilli bacterium]|nr:carcinine hydrolase/isopenicillin-N N-acyltransferase family protein [Bacilli bacterium]